MFETAVNTALVQVFFYVWNSGQRRFNPNRFLCLKQRSTPLYIIQIMFNVWNSGQHRFLYSKLCLMFETAVNTALIQSIISDNL